MAKKEKLARKKMSWIPSNRFSHSHQRAKKKSKKKLRWDKSAKK